MTLQDGDTPLHVAAVIGLTACVERLLSTPGIDVNIKNEVSGSTVLKGVYRCRRQCVYRL